MISSFISSSASTNRGSFLRLNEAFNTGLLTAGCQWPAPSVTSTDLDGRLPRLRWWAWGLSISSGRTDRRAMSAPRLSRLRSASAQPAASSLQPLRSSKASISEAEPLARATTSPKRRHSAWAKKSSNANWRRWFVPPGCSCKWNCESWSQA